MQRIEVLRECAYENNVTMQIINLKESLRFFYHANVQFLPLTNLKV